jgi:hypothetical protein
VSERARVAGHREGGREYGPLLRATLVGVLGLTFGVATAYAQAWLPHEVGSLANSVGSWALLAFLLAFLGTTPRAAALFGLVALVMLIAGYVLGASVRGDPSSSSLMAFWGLASLVAGPVLGLAAYWVRTDRGHLGAAGIGVMSGILIGEGVYGLSTIADTTYPPYWRGQIIVGVVMLGYVAARRLRQPGSRGVAMLCSVVTAAAFVGVYSQDLVSILP